MMPKEGHWYMSDQAPIVYKIGRVYESACEINCWDKYSHGGLGMLHELGYKNLIEIPKEIADIIIMRFY